jgi:hypothetical protein
VGFDIWVTLFKMEHRALSVDVNGLIILDCIRKIRRFFNTVIKHNVPKKFGETLQKI